MECRVADTQSPTYLGCNRREVSVLDLRRPTHRFGRLSLHKQPSICETLASVHCSTGLTEFRVALKSNL